MFKLLKKMTKKDMALIFMAFVFIVIQVWFDLSIPDYMSEITLLVQTEGSSINDILIAGAKMLGCAFGSLIAAVITCLFSSKVGTSFSAVLRKKVFDQVQDFSLEEMNKFSTSSLITRTTNDITQIQNFVVMGLQVIVKAPIMAIWAIIKILGKNYQWSIATLVAVLALIVIVLICIAIAVPKYKKIQTLTDSLNRVTNENLTGIKVVRAYNAEAYQEEKFDTINTSLTANNTTANKALAFMTPTIQTVMNALNLAIYWIGTYLISSASSGIEKLNLFSDMVVYSSYALQVVMAFMMLVMAFIMLPRAFVSAKRINEVLDTKISIKDGNSVINDSLKGEVEFKDVCFKYPNAQDYVLKNISFKANIGETVAFIGSTGCGKSTVINLMPRFFDATSGEVIIDGINVKDYKLNELRNKIGYVSQTAILFQGTIKSNVAFGDNGNKNDLEKNVFDSVSIAEATEFVSKMDNTYDGYVAQYGANLSGGQKQRVSIARAIDRSPEILIFDDSFSALDYKTDRKVRDNIKNKCKGVTTFIVAQRIGTIRDASKIIVLDNGEIVGIGNHESLMKDCEVYKQIALSQLSKEEL